LSAKPVEAVFFWRYSKAAFSAAYGRLPGEQYTKDFLQSPGAQWPVIDHVLGVPPANSSIPIQYLWPGGSRNGTWRKSASDNRGQLSWLPAGQPPAPWKVGDPSTDIQITVPGNPNEHTSSGADTVYATLEAQGLEPWIVAIKLRGEDRILYPRAYLGNPSSELERRSLAKLPSAIRLAMSDLPANTAGGAIELEAPATVRSPELIRKIISTLESDLNVLLVGPPGTGKSVA